jgi:hypothetical protein
MVIMLDLKKMKRKKVFQIYFFLLLMIGIFRLEI